MRYLPSPISFGGLLTLILAAAKLSGHFPHSWPIVFFPLLWRLYVAAGALLIGSVVGCAKWIEDEAGYSAALLFAVAVLLVTGGAAGLFLG